MKIELAVDEEIKTLTYGGLTFYAFATGPTWSAGTNDKYKFGKSGQVFDAQVVEVTIIQKRTTTVEIDEGVTMADYNGNIYALLRPVGSVPNPCR